MNRCKIYPLLLLLCCSSGVQAQELRIGIRPRALNVGVYDYGKVKKSPYRVYHDEEADAKFTEALMQSERLRDSGLFGEYSHEDSGTFDEATGSDRAVFLQEQTAYEYCPALHYVMITGGHGFVSAWDLETLDELFVNPSTYVYSPSGKYRFGTFRYDGMRYYVEIKEGGDYVPYLIHYGLPGEMTGVYWADDETIHYLTEKTKPDGSKYWIGYSTKFYPIDSTP